MNAANGREVSDLNAGRPTIFRRRRYVPPPQTPDQSRRQAEIVQIAWRHFGDATPMIAFLNSHHKQLEARPLTLAIGSDEGLARVVQLLVDLRRA